MRWPTAWPLLVLMAPPLSGCGRASIPPPGPGPTANAPADRGVEEATAILRAINEANPSGGPATPGLNQGVTQVGSHRLRTAMDVPLSLVSLDERSVLSFGGRTLAVEFDRGRVLLDDAERAKLPARTEEVEVRFVGGKLSVTADSTEIFTSERPE